MGHVFSNFHGLIERLIVSKCPSCGRVVKYSGTLCPECLFEYKKERAKICGVCRLPAWECICQNENLLSPKETSLNLRSLVFYDYENKIFMNLLYRLKRDTDRGAEKFFARELAAGISKIILEKSESCRDWRITYPPRTKNSKRKYGFDQSEGLARRISKYTGVGFEKDVFVHKGKALQKTLSGKDRAKNAKSSYALSENADVKGKKYFIVDDVVTTGSTVGSCRMLLLKAGAAEALPVSVSKVCRTAKSDEKALRSLPQNAWFADKKAEKGKKKKKN